ncbi:Uncharacterised protein [Vibrio cholerae]|nr:Uncharacterised protein [Vibrio cholerae]
MKMKCISVKKPKWNWPNVPLCYALSSTHLPI